MFVVYDLGLEFDQVQCAERETAEDARRLRPERIAGVVGLITTPDFRMAELGCVACMLSAQNRPDLGR